MQCERGLLVGGSSCCSQRAGLKHASHATHLALPPSSWQVLAPPCCVGWPDRPLLCDRIQRRCVGRPAPPARERMRATSDEELLQWKCSPSVRLRLPQCACLADPETSTCPCRLRRAASWERGRERRWAEVGFGAQSACLRASSECSLGSR